MMLLSKLLPLVLSSTVTALVHQLTANNFDDFLSKHDLSLISFVTPWCPHCQDLHPSFEEAAARLQRKNVTLAQVDCDDDLALCKNYKVAIYPTIRVFHGKDHAIYDGWRTTDAMVNFGERHTTPLVTMLSSSSEVANFIAGDDVVVVLYTGENDDQSVHANYTDVAKFYRGSYSFGIASGQAEDPVEHVTSPAIVVHNSRNSRTLVHSERFDTQSVKTFVKGAAAPLIREIGRDFKKVPETISGGPSVVTIFAETEKERATLNLSFRSVAESTWGRIIWCIANPADHPDSFSNFGIASGSWPILGMEDSSSGSKFAFPKDGLLMSLNEKQIQEFTADFLNGGLEAKQSRISGADEGSIPLLSSRDEL